MQDETLYVLKRGRAWLLKQELYAGSKAVGEPILTVREQWARSKGRHPVKLTASPSQNGEEITTMLAIRFLGINRRLAVLGEEYQWRRIGGWCSGLRYVPLNSSRFHTGSISQPE